MDKRKEKQMNIHETASHNILAFLESGRLVQGVWSKERNGKKIACLLGAAGGYNSTDECPAELMPRWLAECTVTLFDGISADDVPKLAKRYGLLVGQWAIISDSGWNDVQSRWLVRVIDQAIDVVPAYAKKQSYWPAIEKSVADCKAAIIAQDKDAAALAAVYAGDTANAVHAAIIADDKDAARAAADAAARAALAAYYAARAITRAADAAYYVADYVARASDYAADAADYAFCAAIIAQDKDAAALAAVYAGDTAYVRVARAAVYESLFNGLLDEIEREIGVSTNG